LGRWRYLTFAMASTYLFVAIFLPLGMLTYVSLLPFYTVTRSVVELASLQNYSLVLSDNLLRGAAVNSGLIAVSAAVVTTFAGALLSYTALRTRLRGKRIFEAIGTLPNGFPGLVFGLALLWTFLTFLRPIYGTPWALVIAYMVVFLPLSLRSLSNTMIQLHTELEEAAHVSGASWQQTFRKITLPLIKPALVNTFVLVLIYSYRELGTGVLLSGPGMYVVPVLILFWWRAGQLPVVAAATLIFGGSLILILLLTRLLLLSKRKPRESEIKRGPDPSLG